MLSDSQQRALEVLVAGGQNQAAAKSAGVAPQQVSRWKKLPEFREALGKAQGCILDKITDGLLPLLGPAQEAVRVCLTTGNGTVRIRAAALVYEQLAHCAERQEIQEELEALRVQLEEIKRARDQGPAVEDEARASRPGSSPGGPADGGPADDLGWDGPRQMAG